MKKGTLPVSCILTTVTVSWRGPLYLLCLLFFTLLVLLFVLYNFVSFSFVHSSSFLFLPFLLFTFPPSGVKTTKYIHSSTVLQYNFDILVLYLSISIFCYCLLQLCYISETNIVPLHLSDNFSY